jgi:outer membrane protein assembly factor BamD
MQFTKSFFLSLFIFALLLSSCKSAKTIDDEVEPAELIYDNAIREFEEGNWKKASDEFEKIFFQHPGNDITPKAELMQAYSLYLAGEYDETVDVLDIFIKLHPRHEYIAYAYYLKALANYAQISNVKLDQSRTKFAKEGFEELIMRFPNTKYAIDASLKIDLANDHLAGKEMLVGRYYLKKKNPISAIKRFQTVIDQYDTTAHAPEALYRLIESNLMLGLPDEAQKYAAVLGHNYPDNIWYKKSDALLK